MCKRTMYKRARIPMFLWQRRACANSGVFPRPRKNGLGTRLGYTLYSACAIGAADVDVKTTAHAISTKWRLRHPETPETLVELSVSLFDSFGESRILSN